jgi:phosphomannomutase/phosphoglucomutase
VFDVKCSQALSEDIIAHGGAPVMWKTGHSYIKQKSKEVDAVLAGERSGHIFFRDGYYPYDDAIFAALKLIEYLSSKDESFSSVLKTVPQYVSSPTWHVDCADDKKYDVEKRITGEFKKEYGVERVIDINGARVTFPEGWGLIRSSSNLPVLVMGFEAKTEEGMQAIMDIFRSKLLRYGEVGKEWKSG